MMSRLTSKANCDVITIAYGYQDSCGISYIAENLNGNKCGTLAEYAVV